MSEEQGHVELERLMAALAEAATEAETEPIRSALQAINDRRIAEHRNAPESFAEACGGDLEPGTAVGGGGTLQGPPVHVDVATGDVSGGSFGDDWPPMTSPAA
jgi:hypothetical protein